MKGIVKASALLAIILCGCTGQVNEGPDSLKEAYDGCFKIGCAVNRSIVTGRDTAQLALVMKHFDAISPENDLKPESLHPREGVWNFGPADRYVQFGQDNGLWTLGHTLIWHNQTPDFFWYHADGTPKSREELLETMRSYIETVAGRYNGRINAWDVVNEVVGDDGGYRNLGWVKAFDGDGDEVVRNAFRFAAQYAPDCELYYNDFNVWKPRKVDGIVRLVKMLQAEGIRIDGVGIQAHWGLNYPRTEYIEHAIDTLASLGVKVMVTELDIDVLPISREGQVIGKSLNDPIYQEEEFKEYLDPYRNGLPDDVQKQLADRYAEIMGIFYRHSAQIDRVTFWGLDDGMSWKNGSPVPGRTNYPLLWGRGLKAKPALDAVLSVPTL